MTHTKQFAEDLPHGFSVEKKLKQSPMSHEYILVGTLGDQFAMAYFDGISDTPIAIETYYEEALSAITTGL